MKVYENDTIAIEFRKQPLTEDDSMSILIKSHGPREIARRYYGRLHYNPYKSRYFTIFLGLPLLVLLDYYCKINWQEFEENICKIRNAGCLKGFRKCKDAVHVLKAIVFYNEF